MNRQPSSTFAPSGTPAATLKPYGQPTIGSVNWAGLWALYVKEVRRFFKVHLQTIWAPAISTLLYLIIFTVALGREGRQVLGHPFADFLAPGLIVMAMLQASFANSSFSLLVGKIQGTIVDYLMPPLSHVELIIALVGAAVTRAFLVGVVVWLAMVILPGVSVKMAHPWAVFAYGSLGSTLMGFIGVLTSIWAEKFDHNALITNFVVAPLSLLSGTFYTVDHLAPAFRAVSHANPIFYVISGFRYGFLGSTDSPLTMGLVVLGAVNVVLGAVTYLVLRSGWKIRN